MRYPRTLSFVLIWAALAGLTRAAAGAAPAASVAREAAQAPRGDTEPATTFTAQAELVLVDAVVLDAKGKPVEDLTGADFVVREDGVPQTILRFEAVVLPESAPTRAGSARFVSSNTGATSAERAPARTFVIVFDDAQLSHATGERARAAVKKFLLEGLRDDDEVTLASTASGAWWSTRAGEGRADLLALLDRLKGRRKVDSSGSWISDYEAMRLELNRDGQIGAQVIRRFYENGVILDPANQSAAIAQQELQLGEGHPLVRVKAAEAYAGAKQRNLATLRTLERVAGALAAGKGRKSVILVSDGFVHDATLPEFREVIRAMSRANGVIYFLDARGLAGSAEHASAEVGRATQERDVLTSLGQAQLETEGAQSVALDSGGFSMRNPNNLVGAMEGIARESRAYYLLGYSPTNKRRDGKFRKLQIEVLRPGVEVRGRRGYYAPTDGKQEATTAQGLDVRVKRALDSPYAAADIPLRLAAYVFGPASAGKASVFVVADADPSAIPFERAGERFQAVLESYLVVVARDTGQSYPVEKEIALSLPPGVREQLAKTWLPMVRDLELPPGSYQARLLLRDRHSGRVGTVRHDFEVPPLEGFRVSTPILTDILQQDPKTLTPRPVPLARRVFASGSQLAYLFEVYGATADQAAGGPRVQSRYEVRAADGSSLVRSAPASIRPGPEGQIAQQVAVSLKGAPEGDYEIVFTVEDQVAARTLELRDAFSVVNAPPPSPASARP